MRTVYILQFTALDPSGDNFVEVHATRQGAVAELNRIADEVTQSEVVDNWMPANSTKTEQAAFIESLGYDYERASNYFYLADVCRIDIVEKTINYWSA